MKSILFANWKRALLFVFLTLLLALAMPTSVYALSFQVGDAVLTLPAMIVAWIGGWISYYVLEGLKKYFPLLQGMAAHISSVILAALVTVLNGLLTPIDPDALLGIAIRAVFYFLITWITSQGIFFTKKKDRAASQNVLIKS